MNQIVKVDFHGDMLEATQDGEGRVWVSLRRLCECLGLHQDAQAKKLTGKGWATVREIRTVAEDGKPRDLTAIDLDTLPGWLFSIDARKVKEQVREKLARYQKECAAVLRDHFFGRRVDELARTGDEAVETCARLAAERLVDLLRPEIHGLIQEVRQPLRERNFTIKDRCRQLGWMSASPSSRDKIRTLALVKLRREGYPPPAREALTPGAELLFPESQIGVLDDAILSVWEETRISDEGGMFKHLT